MNSKTANRIVQLEARQREIKAFCSTYNIGSWCGNFELKAGLSYIGVDRNLAGRLLRNELDEVEKELKQLTGEP